jgi:hypothetical protein
VNLFAKDLGLGDRVKLSWTQGGESDVLGYEVLWGDADGAWNSTIDVGDAIFHEISGLVAGKTYWFTVVAYDVCGNRSATAASVSAIPTWGCTCPPIAQTLTPGDYAVVQGTVDWTVKALACSTTTIDHVEFEIDGSTRYVDYADPYEFGDFGSGWTTGVETNGPHVLVARTTDANGCEAADTTTVYVDNTGIGVSCVGVPEGEQGRVEGTYENELVVPMLNMSSVDSYDLDRIVFSWDRPNAYPYQILLDNTLVWAAADFPASASGDTLELQVPMTFPPEYEFEMRVMFWDDPPSAVPELFLADGTYSATFLGGPIVECGPYTFGAASDCTPGVSIYSVNSSNPYDVWGPPAVGDVYYTDRTYTLTYLPSELEGSILVRTPNNDKNTGSSHNLKLEFDRDVTVYIAYDPRGTPPNWIQNEYEDTGLTIGVTDSGTSTLGLWRKNLPAGISTFLGNKAEGWGGDVGTNYVIFVLCQLTLP